MQHFLFMSINYLFFNFVLIVVLCLLIHYSDTETLMNNSGPTPVIVKSTSMENQQAPPQIAQMIEANPYSNKRERGKAFRQVLAAFIANLGTINTGLVFGFSAVVIPQLRQADSIIQIDESQASWIGKWSKFKSSITSK